MMAISKVGCSRLVLCATLMASACGRDSAVVFDDAQLQGQSGSGGSGQIGAGSPADGGEDAAGGRVDMLGGSAGRGEVGEAGAGGAEPGGSAGRPGAGSSGAGNVAGNGAAGSGGSGGTKPNPDPVRLVTGEIQDTYVMACSPQSNFGNEGSVHIDADGICVDQALLIPALVDVPEDAIVQTATLSLTCTNAGGEITARYVSEAWVEGEVRYTTRPKAGDVIGTLTCAEKGPVTFDLSSAVAAWLAGKRPAHGIYLETEDPNGTDFASSEAVDTDTRPVLTVIYTVPPK